MSEYLVAGTDEAPLAFRLRRPVDERMAPIVMLHGLGGDEGVMWSLESALPRDGLVVALRGPYAQRQGGYSWNPIIKAWPPLVSEFTEAVGALEDTLDYLELKHGLHRERVILMGFSNGAAMAFAAAMTPMRRRPAGIIAIAGHLPDGDLSPLRGIPIYWGHGTKDTFIPIENARSDVERLRQMDVPVTFCEADVGHKLGAPCLRDLKAWFHIEMPMSGD